MAEASTLKLRITANPSMAIEAVEFLQAHERRIANDEVLCERLRDLQETHRMFITLPTPGKPLQFEIEPSYPLLEIMAELQR